MKIIICLCLLGTAYFHVGCTSGEYSSGSSTNRNTPENSNISRESSSPPINVKSDDNVSNVTKQPTGKGFSIFLGCWAGLKAGLMEIKEKKILYTAQGKTYSVGFSNVRKKADSETEGYLLDTNGAEVGPLSKVVWLRIAENDDLILYSYKTADDLDINSFVGAGEYVRDKCGK